MARQIPEREVATMEALVKCGVVMVSIAFAYQHIEQENRTMNEPDYTHSSDAPGFEKTGWRCATQADIRHATTQDDMSRAVKIDASQPNLFENITTP